MRGGQLDPRGQLQPLNPLNPAAADVAPGVSRVEGGQLHPPRPLQPLNRAAADVAPGVSRVEGAG